MFVNVWLYELVKDYFILITQYTNNFIDSKEPYTFWRHWIIHLISVVNTITCALSLSLANG